MAHSNEILSVFLKGFGLTEVPVTGFFLVWTDASGDQQALNYIDTITEQRSGEVGKMLSEFGAAKIAQNTAPLMHHSV